MLYLLPRRHHLPQYVRLYMLRGGGVEENTLALTLDPSFQGSGICVEGMSTLELGGTAPATVMVEIGFVLSMNADGAIVAYIASSDGAEISDNPSAASAHYSV